MSPRRNPHVAPVVKWAGGKRQLLDVILPLLPARIAFYCEPFVGGGAVLFARQPRRGLVNDLNSGLMELYAVIRDDVDALIADLHRHENTAEYFYRLRNLDRDPAGFSALSPVERASRLLYLNKSVPEPRLRPRDRRSRRPHRRSVACGGAPRGAAACAP